MSTVTARLSTMFADKFRSGRCIMASATLALGACLSGRQPPPLEPRDIASMSYMEVRTWLETWMIGARDPMGVLKPVSPTFPQLPPDPTDERAGDPGTPTDLSGYEDFVIDRAVLRDCELQLFPGSTIIQLHGVDSLAVEGGGMHLHAPFHVPWWSYDEGQPEFRRFGLWLQFGSPTYAEQAMLVWRRASEMCSQGR